MAASPFRRMIDDAGLAHASVARELGVARSTLCGWLNGTRPMPAKRRAELRGLLERRARLLADQVRDLDEAA